MSSPNSQTFRHRATAWSTLVHCRPPPPGPGRCRHGAHVRHGAERHRPPRRRPADLPGERRLLQEVPVHKRHQHGGLLRPVREQGGVQCLHVPDRRAQRPGQRRHVLPQGVRPSPPAPPTHLAISASACCPLRYAGLLSGLAKCGDESDRALPSCAGGVPMPGAGLAAAPWPVPPPHLGPLLRPAAPEASDPTATRKLTQP